MMEFSGPGGRREPGPPVVCRSPFCMKKNLSRSVALCAGLLLSVLLSAPARCQRQTSGRPSFDAYVNFAFDGGFRVAGGGALWCNYDYLGRTTLGLDVFSEGHSFTEEAVVSNGELVAPEILHEFVATDVCADVGYLFRLLSPRSRAVILSAGGHMLVGAKYAPEMSGFYKDGGSEKRYSQVGFFLGLVPEMQLEVFPFRNVSVYVSARPRVRLFSGLGGSDGWLALSGAAGFKVYL